MADELLRVFLSYARADSSSFVDRLEADLTRQHVQPWVDRHRIEGGAEWLEMIQEAIDHCQALVVVLSPAAVHSKYVRMEYRYASFNDKLVVPALYLPTTRIPIDLHLLQWVDFQPSYQDGLEQLVQALTHHTFPASPSQPTPAPPEFQKSKEQWMEEAKAHRRAHRFNKALAAYQKAIEVDAHYMLAYTGKGWAFQQLERFQEALEAYERAAELDPASALAYNGIGNALWELHRSKEALEAYNHAIQLDPTYGYAYTNKGNLLESRDQYQEALELYEQALLYNPAFGLAWLNKGRVLQKLGRTTEAEQALQKAHELGE